MSSELKYGETSLTTYEGDTFIDFFRYVKQSFDLLEAGAGNTSYYVEARIPIESSIATSLRYDKIRDFRYNYHSLIFKWPVNLTSWLDKICNISL